MLMLRYLPALLAGAPRVAAQVQLDIQRRDMGRAGATTTTRSRLRRDEAHTQPIDLRHDRSVGQYFVTGSVGTPGQALDLQIRTDQSLSWFPSSNSTYCIEDVFRTCAEHGSFSQNLSSTFQISNETFERTQTLRNGTKNIIAQGYHFNDTLGVGDVSVDNLTMGIAYDFGVFNSGILGLGYGGEESGLPDDNLAVQLVAKGLIPTAAFSVWLNDENSTAGSLLFGAIDQAKFEGDLIIIDSFNSSAFGSMIWLSYVEASSPSGTDVFQTDDSEFPLGFALGTASTTLPDPLAKHMWAVAGAEYWYNSSIPIISCDMRYSAGSYAFRFGGSQGPLISVSLRHFVWPPDRSYEYFQELSITNVANGSACVFTLLNTTDPSNYFVGENFLQAAYFVMDLYNEEIAMAPTRFDVDDTDIVTFLAHGAEAPSATYASSQPTAKPTIIENTTSLPAFTPSSSYAAAAGFASLTNTATIASPTSTSQSSGSLSTGAKAGIGVGVSLGVILVALASFLLYRRRRRQTVPRYTPEAPTASGAPSQAGEYKHPVSELGSPKPESAAAAEMPGSAPSPSLNYGSPAELSPSTSPVPGSNFSDTYSDVYGGHRRAMSRDSDYTHELDAVVDSPELRGSEAGFGHVGREGGRM
ncbi:aspartic peptidase domain-containing protein [Xylariaceae sp. FL0016]|nr:aspartic peptidase domain-containing protein [Xylariaceae sp. FL0016]